MKTKLFITGGAITLGLAGCSNLLAGMAGNTGPAYRPSPCGTTTTAEANGLTLAFERAYRAQDGKLIVVIRLANYTQGWIERQFDIAGNLARMTSERGLFSGSGFEALDGDSAGSRSGELGPDESSAARSASMRRSHRISSGFTCVNRAPAARSAVPFRPCDAHELRSLPPPAVNGTADNPNEKGRPKPPFS